MDFTLDQDDLIAALATPKGQSALALLRISGPGCIEKLSPCFRGTSPQNTNSAKMTLSRFIDPQSSKEIDQVMFSCFRAPRSYTGQDMLEISCHGSLPAVAGIMDCLRAHGCRDAGPGEFTLRAFLNGKMDLTQAEAVQEIVSARSRRSSSLALHRLSGEISRKIDEIKQKLLHLMTQLEIQLDYPEDEVDDQFLETREIQLAKTEVEALLATYRVGRLYQDGLKLVLAGRTNAGKSSLFNLLLKEERSIVSEVHGTTRDYLETWISLDSVPLLLYDTAGLRHSRDPIEEEGIRRSRRLIENADCVLFLVSAEEGLQEEDREILEQLRNKKVIKLWTKTDLGQLPAPEGFLSFSLKKSADFIKLEKSLIKMVHEQGAAEDDSLLIDSTRQKTLLERCLESLINFEDSLRQGLSLDILALDLKEALDALGEITGEVSNADMLREMFSRFCVGK